MSNQQTETAAIVDTSTPEYREAFKKQYPHRAEMAKGQSSNSVLWLPAAEAPHNIGKMVEEGHIKLVNGRFLRP